MTFSAWSQSALLYASAMEGNSTFHNCKFQNLPLSKTYQLFYYNKEIKIWMKPLFSFSNDDNIFLYLWFELYFGTSLRRSERSWLFLWDYKVGEACREVSIGYFFSLTLRNEWCQRTHTSWLPMQTSTLGNSRSPWKLQSWSNFALGFQ